MFGNQKNIEKMMKKLNLNVRQVDADEVVIKGKNKKIIIRKPEIMIADMMGREVYQITGSVEESVSASEDDIQLVMQQTGKDRKTVVEKLEELDNDLARAIIELKGK